MTNAKSFHRIGLTIAAGENTARYFLKASIIKTVLKLHLNLWGYLK